MGVRLVRISCHCGDCGRGYLTKVTDSLMQNGGLHVRALYCRVQGPPLGFTQIKLYIVILV